MNRLIFIILLFHLGFLVSCGNRSNAPEKSKEPEQSAIPDSLDAGTSLTREQMKSIGLELGFIEKKQLTATLKANGFLKVPNQNKAGITSLYSGTIKTLLVQEGDQVQKGQTIATITNPRFIELQEELLTLNGKMALADLEYKRQKALNEGNAGALKNLQQAAAESANLSARLASMRQQLQIMGIQPESISNGHLITTINIKSPIRGTVSSVQVQIGTFINDGTLVAEVVDNSQLHLDLFVYEKDLPRLKDRQIIHFTLTNNPGKEYDAVIYSIGTAFENSTKSIPIHAKVRGDKTGLIEGMNITAIVSLDKATVPAVPSDAVVNYQGQDYIFIEQGPDNDAESSSVKFKKVPVAKGDSDIGYVEITPLHKIPDHAKVVVKGAFFILAKMTNKSDE
jgi:RND family efflux transporter MFP subunit